MPLRGKESATKCLEFLNVIEKKQGKASKFDLWKIAGNEAAFKRWITNTLQRHHIVEEVREGKQRFFRKTEKGETVHKMLRDWDIVVLFKRLGGKRLKRETQVNR